MENLLRDLRHGARMLLKAPGFTLVAVLSLALGIGPNAAIFTLVDALLLRPLPVQDPDRLVRVYAGGEAVSYPDYVFYRDHSDVFSGLMAESSINLAWGRQEGAPERIVATIVSGNYFSVLGVRPVLGRAFLPEEDKVPGLAPVAVISNAFWRRSFAGDPAVIGRQITLNGRSFTIIGVAPPEFTGTFLGQEPAAWIPFMMHAVVWPGKDRLNDRKLTGIYITGRLKPDQTVEQAQVALDTLHRRLVAEHPESITSQDSVFLESGGLLHRSIRQPVLAFTTLLSFVVGFVLLISCANLANLLLARGIGRHHEIAIRQALGARRSRIVVQLLTESLLLALLGGIAGLLLALVLLPLLIATPLSSLPIPISIDLSPDMRVLTFTLALSILTALLFGLAPALRTARTDLVSSLKDEANAAGAVERRFGPRGLLAILQIGLSLLLLVGAGLFIRSLQNARSVDPGFDMEKLLIASVDQDAAGHSEAAGREFYSNLTETARGIPGVEAAGLAAIVPLTLNNMSLKVLVDGADMGNIFFNYTSPGFFSALGIEVLHGRDFGPEDRQGGLPVAIVNQTMAKRLWPNQKAVGQHLQQLDFNGPSPNYEVVGVVADSKYLSLGEEPRPVLYLPFLQHYQSEMHLHIRASQHPETLLSTVQQTLQGVDPSVPIEVKTASSEMGGIALLVPRLGASLLGIFGSVGLVLAAVGLYGLMAFSVSQRLREIGIRMALGGHRRQILRLVVGQGLKLSLVGVAAGLMMSFVMSRLLSSFLYGVSATDPVIFIGISLLLVAVASIAVFIPARRAAQTDPMRVLKGG